MCIDPRGRSTSAFVRLDFVADLARTDVTMTSLHPAPRRSFAEGVSASARRLEA